MIRISLILCACALIAAAQEASSGFELRTTVSASSFYDHELQEAPRNGSALYGSFRAVIYPTWKLSSNWSAVGAIEVLSHPNLNDELSENKSDVQANVLQAALLYSRLWNGGAVVFRLGTMPSAFGSFLLRYDDAANPMIGVPLSYGYGDESGIVPSGLTGAQVDATFGKVDIRGQIVNSSPVSPHAALQNGQFRNWSAGAGYTVRQGFRVGFSGYGGPYIDPDRSPILSNTATQRTSATAIGMDIQWGRGPLNVYGEWQRFEIARTDGPAASEHSAYIEARYVLHPRWYVAVRDGYLRSNTSDEYKVYDTVVGFRPNSHQLLKIGYKVEQGSDIRGTLHNALAIQLVTSIRALSIDHR